jgi:glyoxylase-like metal-dependent hydrolase (beta-lactamase superfamily II)
MMLSQEACYNGPGRKGFMRIRQPGKVCDRLWCLGREESCVYLLEGRDGFLLLNGGMSYIVPDLLAQFEEFGIDAERITAFLILHSHFDHVGIVPFLKRRYPQIEVYASTRAWEILHMTKAVNTINAFSRSVAERMGRESVYAMYDLEWQDNLTGKPIREGEKIDLGDLSVSILEIPGHSSCSIAAYASGLRALFPSDGLGIPFKDIILASGNSNYTQYQKNLQRLKDLQIDYLCADHYGYIVGEEAGEYVARSAEAARQFRGLIEETYHSAQDTDAAAGALTTLFYTEHPNYFLSPEIFHDIHRQMVRHIVGMMEGNP